LEVSETTEQEMQKKEATNEEGLSKIEPGVVLQERYHVTDILVQENGEVILEAEDQRTCWSCQTLLSESHLRFCEMCGAELTKWPQVRLHAQQPRSKDQIEDEAQLEKIEHNGVNYSLEKPDLNGAAQQIPPILRYELGIFTDKGQQREINEDSLVTLQLDALCQTNNDPVAGFFAVADGMGGHAAGEVASRIAVHVLVTFVMQEIFPNMTSGQEVELAEIENKLKTAVSSANQAIMEARDQEDMGSTLTAALFVGKQAIIANVGDSRTYLMRNGSLNQITRDHSKVARLVEQNLLEADAIYTHEDKGMVYRCLGDKQNLEVETSLIDLEIGDRFLLCSDGLWEMVRDPFIEDTLLEQFDPQLAARRLVDLANLSGGEDNISVIVVDIQSLD
jgi:serine/threonine protein phosphatase PrpC